MKLWNILKISILLQFSLFIFNFNTVAQPLSPEELATKKIYTSLSDAIRNPADVYRLTLTGKPKCDSLPDELFTLVNLQELTVKRCKLLVLNRQISQLQNLQYLNLDWNRLVSLPEAICDLKELKKLVISRNYLLALPENMGRLTKLEIIDAWETQIYVLPKSIAKLSETLKTLDLRQVAIKAEEYEEMEKLLPKTKIHYTSFCECKNER